MLAGLVDAEDNDRHAATIEALVSGELVASWAVYEPGKPWAPLARAVTATPTDTGYRHSAAEAADFRSPGPTG